MANDKSIFRPQAVEQMSSPDELDKYLKVTNPRVWLALIAVFALLAGLTVWGAFGAINTSISSTAVRLDTDVICFIDRNEVVNVKVGDDVYVNGKAGKVKSVASVPLSQDEARKELGSDYLCETVLTSKWGYQIALDVESEESLPEKVPLTCTITTERVSPFEYMAQSRVG